jgi:hypothetical protein
MRLGEVEIEPVLDGVLRYDPTDTYGPESGGKTAALAGDLFHHPVELDRPELLLPVDAAPDEAAQQRSRWQQTLSGTTVFAPHFPDMAPVTLDAARR